MGVELIGSDNCEDLALLEVVLFMVGQTGSVHALPLLPPQIS